MSSTLARVVAFTVLLCTVSIARSQSPQPQIKVLPSETQWLNEPKGFTSSGRDSFAITAGKNTDWFASPLDEALTATSPKLVFKVDEDFVLTSKVTPDFKTTWDAGVLLVYLDERNWAKLCFEMTVDKRPSVVTVVTHGASDDSVSMPIASPAVYMKIAKTGNVIFFYVSSDGRSWQMVRSFRMQNVNGLRAGFSSQSPAGEGCRTEFSEISYMKKRITDIWSGE